MTAEIDKDDIPKPDDNDEFSDKSGTIKLSPVIDIINVVTNTNDEIERRMTTEEIPIDELANTIASGLSHIQ